MSHLLGLPGFGTLGPSSYRIPPRKTKKRGNCVGSVEEEALSSLLGSTEPPIRAHVKLSALSSASCGRFHDIATHKESLCGGYSQKQGPSRSPE